MLVLTGEEVAALATMPRVIACIEEAFVAGYVAPPRQVVNVPGPGERLFLSMPAFAPGGRSAVKLVNVFPDNSANGLPSIQAAIVVFSNSGSPMALLDGTAVTRLRTGAASAVASKHLSRSDSSHLVIVGTGSLAPIMAAAHCTVRPIKRISVWGRRSERAIATAREIRSLVAEAVEVCVAPSIACALGTADIVSCATSSSTPVVAGELLRPGTFVDAVGSFSASKREVDDDVVRRSRIFVDTFEGALSEAGDVLDPLSRGVIDRRRIEGELADLVSGRVQGRKNAEEMTFFKAVGTAIEDLAVANMIVTKASSRRE